MSHIKPEHEWEHSHLLKEGQVITDGDGEWIVTSVHDNGDVDVRRIDDGRSGPNDKDTWSENAVRNGLAFGEIEREDGKSHELATF